MPPIHLFILSFCWTFLIVFIFIPLSSFYFTVFYLLDWFSHLIAFLVKNFLIAFILCHFHGHYFLPIFHYHFLHCIVVMLIILCYFDHFSVSRKNVHLCSVFFSVLLIFFIKLLLPFHFWWIFWIVLLVFLTNSSL